VTSDHWLVYEFMVTRFGGISFDSKESFTEALLTGGVVTKRFVPAKTWGMYNIDTRQTLAEGYLCRYGFDLVKVKNDMVSEYYRRTLSSKDRSFVAYDLETLDVIEYYQNEGEQVVKYNAQTNQRMQGNVIASYEALPNDFKSALQDFRYKESVFMYAIKPYGRVVEFYYPKS
jgi:hypothetical protein